MSAQYCCPQLSHDEILDAVGLDLDPDVPVALPSPRRRRDPAFRETVLRAYGYRCAVCGFEARVGGALVGVDPAHVRWHQAGGAGGGSSPPPQPVTSARRRNGKMARRIVASHRRSRP